MKKNKRNGIKHILALLLFCMVVSIGMVSLADEKGTVIAKSAVIRAAADPNSTKLASVPSGKVIDVIGKATGTDSNKWYQVYVDGNTKGYIRGDLLKVDNDANLPTVDGGNASSQPADTTSATVNPTEGTQVTVISNNTNIRREASTTSESLAKANRGSTLIVTGETTGTDGKKWYQVSFAYQNEQKTGFIRADLVTADNVPADTATAQITGEGNPGEAEPSTEPPADTEPPAEPPAEPAQPDSDTITVLNVDTEPPYIMEEFTSRKFTLPGDDQEYNGYVNGKFLICYARKSNGEEGWYLVDIEQNVFQRYAYTVDGVVVPKGGLGSAGLIPIIVLVVIIIVLVAAVGFLVLKLKGQGSSYKRYRGYDEEDYQDDDIEDLEELEDDDEEPQPVRRSQGPQPRRPQGGSPSVSSASQGQPVRRPQGQQPPRHPQSQQPPRRSQGQIGNAPGQIGNAPVQGGNPSGGSTSQGLQPRRPQGQMGNPANNGGARPQNQQPLRRPQGGNSGQPPRRPQPQNDRVSNDKGQKGYKAKNLLEDDDMDFMDIE